MKCQILFSRKNKKNISKCCLLNFLLSMQGVKDIVETKIMLKTVFKNSYWFQMLHASEVLVNSVDIYSQVKE